MADGALRVEDCLIRATNATVRCIEGFCREGSCACVVCPCYWQMTPCACTRETPSCTSPCIESSASDKCVAAGDGENVAWVFELIGWGSFVLLCSLTALVYCLCKGNFCCKLCNNYCCSKRNAQEPKAGLHDHSSRSILGIHLRPAGPSQDNIDKHHVHFRIPRSPSTV